MPDSQNNLIPCRVCHRPLRSLISRTRGIGPICIKKVRRELEEFLQREMKETGSRFNSQLTYAMAPEELQRRIEEQARQAYLEQVRYNRRPSREPVTVGVDSQTREIIGEPTTVEWLNSETAEIHSESGHTYHATHSSCDCPDFIYRRSRDPELAREGCRHMQALRLAEHEVVERRRLRRTRPTTSTEPVVEIHTPDIHEQNQVTFSQTDWTVEEQRERVLNIWRENRPWDGIYISRDDAAWQSLQNLAREEWEYKYENVLGGTENSFGVEIEMKFRDQNSRAQALRELHNEGLTLTSEMRGYHSGEERGFWKPERDGSLGENGVELVSPVLQDTPESWRQIERITKILHRHGAYVDHNCGGHIHLGIAPLDHRTYSWQRFARIGVMFERQLYRMGGADSEKYRNQGEPGRHRGTSYANSLPNGLSFNGEIEASVARRKISLGDRYTIFNTTNIDSYVGRPAVEMRYPNGSLDHRQIQAQIQVANSIIHQAAVIRNESPQSEFTPRFSETNRHLRLRGLATPEREESNFREFLDVLGNPEDRLAATWLWMRGRI